MAEKYVRWLSELGSGDVALVGGKNASLGEMIRTLEREGVRVPDGFATTAAAYWAFLDHNNLRTRIAAEVEAMASGSRTLGETGEALRRMFLQSEMPPEIAAQIRQAYRELSRRYGRQNTDVAVRSSATAEDLPEASFAGQQETFLNVTGESELINACRRCFSSLFTDRAIAYRERQGFAHTEIALSVGVQKMVRSDQAGAGVMFTIDTETGFPKVVVINAAWGLGESVVKGTVNPDEYIVFKPLLGSRRKVIPIVDKTPGSKEHKLIYAEGGPEPTRTVDTIDIERKSFVLEDREILQLARWAVVVEKHYGRPMDLEWAKDGMSGDLYIVQARPETVQSRKVSESLRTYKLKETGRRLASGAAIGQGIVAGKARVLHDPLKVEEFEEGSILVTEMTDPDWVPLMKRAAAIVTDSGGRTSHAAIVSRELGVPAIVGTGKATTALKDGDEITVSCAEGDQGYVYEGILAYEASEIDFGKLPATRTKIMMNMANPAAAFRWWKLPCDGIGLARMEFIINNQIKIHPMALAHLERVKDPAVRKEIERLTVGYSDRTEYFVDRLARGIARIAAAQYPDPVIVRMSDFKTNEYANLIGGGQFEQEEENPMLGFRGASRYYSDRYRDAFALECRAIRRVRNEIGLDKVIVMIPFCRTPQEGRQVLEVMAEYGLKRGEDGLLVYMMSEVPSNIVLAEEFARYFDGFSIGSNDLTQLVLGVDRDSAELSYLFDERDESVKRMIAQLIEAAHQAGRPVGICGQAPSDYPEFAAYLVESGIDSISLNPDSVIRVKRLVAQIEAANLSTRKGGQRRWLASKGKSRW
ncbi:MAG: phosphoenolpyruvate synthase [Bryobacteraceae bacterium]